MLASKEVRSGKGGVVLLDGRCSHNLGESVELDAESIIRLITLNAMKASDEITEEQSRQVNIGFI